MSNFNSNSNNSPPPFRLLDLPPELVTKILTYAVLSPYPLSDSPPDYNQIKIQTQAPAPAKPRPRYPRHRTPDPDFMFTSQAPDYPSPLLAPFPLPATHILKPTISLSPHYLPNAGGRRHAPPLSLLLTNHRISAETHHLYYTLHNFFMILHRNLAYLRPPTPNPNLETFLSPKFSHTLQAIRSLEIRIHNWRSKEWFLMDFIPAISKCIHKGQLRSLDIYVPSQVVTSWAQDARRGESFTKQKKNWVALKELLENEDLVEARLWAFETLCSIDPAYVAPRRTMNEGCWRKEKVSDMSWLLDRSAKGLEGIWTIETYVDHAVKYRRDLE